MGRGKRAGHVRPAEPQRRCVGCREARPQRELLRLVVREGAVAPGAKAPGRGCYLCRNERCAAKAVKSGQIKRALKGKAEGPALGRVLDWIQGSTRLTATEPKD